MLFMIYCEDMPNSMPVRMQTRPAHLSYIQPLVDQNRLFCAGPTPHVDEDKGMSGSLIIAEFDSYSDALNWAQNDPYALAGLFGNVIVKPYKKVLP